MATAQSVINAVRFVINDQASAFVSGLRWSDAELFKWISDAESAVVTLDPESNSVVSLFTVTGGKPRQRLNPAAAHKLIRVEANGIGVGMAFEYGSVVRITEKDALDSLNSEWVSPSSRDPVDYVGTYYDHYAMDNADPLAFWLWPRPVAGADVVVTYVGIPAQVTALGDVLTLSDMYVPHIIDYVVYRALSKESRAGTKEVADAYYNKFLAALGASRQIVRQTGQNTTRPPNAEA